MSLFMADYIIALKHIRPREKLRQRQLEQAAQPPDQFFGNVAPGVGVLKPERGRAVRADLGREVAVGHAVGGSQLRDALAYGYHVSLHPFLRTS